MRTAKRGRKRKAGAGTWCLRVLVLLLLAAVGLSLVGIPGSWVTGLLRISGRVPGRLEISEIRWRPGHGWYLPEISWFAPRDLTRPLLIASDMELQVHPRNASGRLIIGEARVKTDLGVWTRDLITRQPLSMTGISGSLRWEKNHLEFEKLRAQVADVQLYLSGRVERVDGGSPAGPAPVEETAARVARALVPVLRGLETFQAETPPVVEVRVAGSTSAPLVDLSMFYPDPFQVRGQRFERLRIVGRLEDRTLSVPDFLIAASDNQQLTGVVEVDFDEEMFALDLENTLSRDALEAVSPLSPDTFLSRLDLRVEGSADFTLQVGPAPFQEPGRRVSGSFQVEKGSYRDAYFPEASFDLELDQSLLRLPSFSGTVGPGENPGSVSGSLELDARNGMLRLQVEGAANPENAVSLVGPEVESLLREWEFRGSPPEFSLDVEKVDRASPLNLSLLTRAEQAVWRGTLFHQVRAKASMDRRGLRVTDVVATRGQHLLQGSFEFPPDLGQCAYTMESSFPLPDLLPLLGQTAVDVIRPFRFLGTTRFSSSGTVDLSGNHKHDLSGRAQLESVVFRWIRFMELNSSFVVKGESLDLPDVEGTLVEGTLTGDVRLRDMFSPEASFETSMIVRDVDLFELITKATDQATTPYTGTLDLDLSLQGALHDSRERRRAETYSGEGEVEIRDGELFRIPLLLGLSNILSKITKGFGYASQGDFQATFEVVEGRVSSRDVFLGGSLMSIAGEAAYDLDTRKLDGNVKVQLLKDGVMSDALKVLLWPIRKLIEVSLTGTIDAPDWRPRNLPKELFGK